MHRTFRIAAALVGSLALALIAATGLSGRQAGRPEPETLILLVRVTDDTNEMQIFNTLTKGLEVTQTRPEFSPGCRCDPPRIRPIPAVVFDSFNSSRETATVELSKPGEEKFQVRRLPELPDVWLIKHEPGYHLKNMKVRLTVPKESGPDGKEKTLEKREETFNAEFRSVNPAAPLALLTPNSYALRLPEGSTPEQYDAVLVKDGKEYSANLTPKGPGKEDWRSFTSGDRFYMVTLGNFEGEKEVLFNVIREQPEGRKQYVANPVKEIAPVRKLSLIFASWGMRGITDGDVFQGNNYTCSIITPKPVDKVYIRFPLDEQERNNEMKKYNALDSLSLIKEIKKEIEERKEEANAITRDSKPGWYELSLVPDSNNRKFTKSFPLQDFPGLLKRYPSASFLEVYAISDEAVYFQKGSNRQLANARDIDEWRLGLTRRKEAEEARKKSEGKKDPGAGEKQKEDLKKSIDN